MRTVPPVSHRDLAGIKKRPASLQAVLYMVGRPRLERGTNGLKARYISLFKLLSYMKFSKINSYKTTSYKQRQYIQVCPGMRQYTPKFPTHLDRIWTRNGGDCALVNAPPFFQSAMVFVRYRGVYRRIFFRLGF